MSSAEEHTNLHATENVAEAGDEGKFKTLTNILKKCQSSLDYSLIS